MIKYMQHEKHGIMPVYTQVEFDRHVKLGWSEYFFEENKKEKKTEISIEKRYEEKFGKRPHWKMKPETIKAALEE